MTIELLCGPANSGKVRRIMDLLLDDVSAGRPVWLLVPTAADIRRAREELLRRRGVLLGVSVGTCTHLVDAAVGGTGRLIPPGADLIAIRRLIGTGPFSEGASRYPGFAATATRIVTELREAAILGPEAVAAATARFPRDEKAGWTDLVERYSRWLDEVGFEDDAARAGRCLEGPWWGGLESAPSLFAWGFDDFSPLQQRLLQAAATVRPVVVTMPFEPGRIAFHKRQELIDSFRNIGARVDVAGASMFASPALQALEHRFFEPTAQPLEEESEAPASIAFTECCGPLQEAEEVARHVVDALARGIPSTEIACLSVSGSVQRQLMDVAFRRAGLRPFFEFGRLLPETPGGRAMLALIDAVTTDDPLAWAAWKTSRVAGGDTDLVERWLSDHPAEWKQTAPATDSERLLLDTPAEETTVQILNVCAVLETASPFGTGERRLVGAAVHLLRDLHAVTRVEGRVLTLEEYRLALTRMPIPPPSERDVGSILIAPATRVRTDRFHTVVVFSLEDHTPSATFQSADDTHGSGREVAYVAITRPTHALAVVRQHATSAGSPLSPHPAWTELTRLLPNAPRRRRGLERERMLASELVTIPEAIQWIADHRAGIDSTELDAHPAVAEAAQVLDGRTQPVPPDLCGEAMRHQFAQRTHISVSEIQNAIGCRARWFINSLIDAGDDPESERRRLTGTVAHDALAEIVPRIAEGIEPTSTLIRDAINRAAHECGADAVSRRTAELLVHRTLEDEAVEPGTRVDTEVPFGMPGSTLGTVSAAGLSLRGRIDRIDLLPTGGLIVQDYKSGTIGPTHGAQAMVRDGHVQLAVYESVINASSTYPGDVRASVYRPLRGGQARGIVDSDVPPGLPPTVRTDKVDPDRRAEICSDAISLVEETISGLRNGHIGADPRGGSCPTWCDLGNVCRVGEFRSPVQGEA